jgi:hypothetical protein
MYRVVADKVIEITYSWKDPDRTWQDRKFATVTLLRGSELFDYQHPQVDKGIDCSRAISYHGDVLFEPVIPWPLFYSLIKDGIIIKSY